MIRFLVLLVILLLADTAFGAGLLTATLTYSQAYDSIGHLVSELADNGVLQTARSYSGYSNLLLAHSITPGAGRPLWDVSAMTYAGSKVSGYTLKSRFEIASASSYASSTGTVYSMQYDNDGRLSSTRATPGNAPGTASQNYDENFNFAFDASGRSLWNLQTVQSGTVNGSGQVVGVVSSQYEYQPTSMDRVAEITRSNAATPDVFVYDERGRGAIVTHKTAADTTAPHEQFTYDSMGRLATIKVNGVLQEQLAYDAEGFLVSRTFSNGASGADTARYYMDGDLTVVKRGSATLAYAHIILGKKRVASGYYASPSTAGQPLYYQRDRLGSVVGTSTAGGVPGLSFRYDIYGKVTSPASSLTDANASELGYTGGLNLTDGLLPCVDRA